MFYFHPSPVNKPDFTSLVSMSFLHSSEAGKRLSTDHDAKLHVVTLDSRDPICTGKQTRSWKRCRSFYLPYNRRCPCTARSTLSAPLFLYRLIHIPWLPTKLASDLPFASPASMSAPHLLNLNRNNSGAVRKTMSSFVSTSR